MALWVEIRCESQLSDDCSEGVGSLTFETVRHASHALALLKRQCNEAGWKNQGDGLVCLNCQLHQQGWRPAKTSIADHDSEQGGSRNG